MDAVEALLAERAWSDLRVEDVMSAAGLTRTAFYRYFPDLEAVLLALLASVRAELADAANRWLLLDADPYEGIIEANTALARVWSQHRAVLAAFSDAATSGSRIQKAWHQMVDSFLEPVEKRFADLTRRRLISLEHPSETARALVWMNERYLFETFARGRAVSVEDAGATLSQVWSRVLFFASRQPPAAPPPG